jgi:hypothetical protein
MSTDVAIETGSEASTGVVWMSASTRLANCLRPPFRMILLVCVKAQSISIVCGVGPCLKRRIISMKQTTKIVSFSSFSSRAEGSIGVI